MESKPSEESRSAAPGKKPADSGRSELERELARGKRTALLISLLLIVMFIGAISATGSPWLALYWSGSLSQPQGGKPNTDKEESAAHMDPPKVPAQANPGSEMKASDVPWAGLEKKFGALDKLKDRLKEVEIDRDESKNTAAKAIAQKERLDQVLKQIAEALGEKEAVAGAQKLGQKLAQNRARVEQLTEEHNGLEKHRDSLVNKIRELEKQIRDAEGNLARLDAAKSALEGFNGQLGNSPDDEPANVAASALAKAYLFGTAAIFENKVNDPGGGLRTDFQNRFRQLDSSLNLLAARQFPIKADSPEEHLLLLCPETKTNVNFCKTVIMDLLAMHGELKHWETVLPKFRVSVGVARAGLTVIRTRDKVSQPTFTGEEKSTQIDLKKTPGQPFTRCVLVLACSSPSQLELQYPLPIGVPVELVLVVPGKPQEFWGDDPAAAKCREALTAWQNAVGKTATSTSTLTVVFYHKDEDNIRTELRRRLLPASLFFPKD